LDLLDDYGVTTTFNVSYLLPFVDGDDYIDEVDLRTNSLQERWYDEGSLEKKHIESLTRAMAKRLEEEEGLQKSLLMESNILTFLLNYFSLVNNCTYYFRNYIEPFLYWPSSIEFHFGPCIWAKLKICQIT